jgi:hypothetical protein
MYEETLFISTDEEKKDKPWYASKVWRIKAFTLDGEPIDDDPISPLSEVDLRLPSDWYSRSSHRRELVTCENVSETTPWTPVDDLQQSKPICCTLHKSKPNA